MASSPLVATRRPVAAWLSAALLLAFALMTGNSSSAATGSVARAFGPVRFAPISMKPNTMTPNNMTPNNMTPNNLTRTSATPVLGSTTSDWAGWAASGNHYSSVSASWTQPSVQCSSHETSDSAFWVGLDGFNSGSVEQVGVQAGCSSGRAFYAAWTEFYPAPSHNITNHSVLPGDALSANVNLTGGHSYRLTITDSTRNWTVQLSGTAPRSSNVSAEVVTEAPTDGNTGRMMQLSNFHAVSFTRATINGNSLSQANQLHQLTMGSTHRVMAQPTGVSGTAFGVSWRAASG